MADESHDLTKARAYTADSIVVREGLEAMRGTPTLFLSDLEHGGITHSVLEVITNSNDELIEYPHQNAKLTVVLCKDEARRTFQWIVADTGRGMPFEAGPTGTSVFINCLTKPHTSGKFDQDSYTISGGQFGVGLKATTAMSKILRCITHRTTGSASLTVRQGKFGPEDFVVNPTPIAMRSTGTTTVFEPDDTIFVGVDNYTQLGYMAVVSLLRQMVFFRFRNIEFRISDVPVTDDFWNEPDTAIADQKINHLIHQAPVIWAATNNDGDEWIKSYWNLHRNFTWSAEIELSPEEKHRLDTGTEKEQRLRDVILKLYFVRGDRLGGVFALVNSVPIPNRSADHVHVVATVLKEELAHLITDAGCRKFFIENYAIPLFYAINVDYKGARFSNAAKTDFKEGDFRRIYTDLMHHWFHDTERGTRIVRELYEILQDDIEKRYADSLGEKTQAVDMSRLWTRLKKPRNFIDASPDDGNRSECELILLEGKSTGGGTEYDTERQGFYFMQGKPSNIIKGTGGNRNEIIANALRHDVISDILKIINFDPRKPDLSKLYFSRVLICTDAD